MTFVTPATRNRQREGLERITGRMMVVLVRLRDAKAADMPFVDLSDVYWRTLRALQARDWIFEAKGIDGVRYAITGRGLKALAIYEREGNRRDGKCPRCRTRERARSRTGKRRPYCESCTRAIAKRQYALKGYQYDPDAPCSRCKKRPRLILASGIVIAYCEQCRRERRYDENRRRLERKLRRIAAGDVPKCLKCDNPVYYTARSVSDYCAEHVREAARLNYARRRQRKEGAT